MGGCCSVPNAAYPPHVIPQAPPAPVSLSPSRFVVVPPSGGTRTPTGSAPPSPRPSIVDPLVQQQQQQQQGTVSPPVGSGVGVITVEERERRRAAYRDLMGLPPPTVAQQGTPVPRSASPLPPRTASPAPSRSSSPARVVGVGSGSGVGGGVDRGVATPPPVRASPKGVVGGVQLREPEAPPPAPAPISPPSLPTAKPAISPKPATPPADTAALQSSQRASERRRQWMALASEGLPQASPTMSPPPPATAAAAPASPSTPKPAPSAADPTPTTLPSPAAPLPSITIPPTPEARNASLTSLASSLPIPIPTNFEAALQQATELESASLPRAPDMVASPFPERSGEPPLTGRDALIAPLAAALNGVWVLDEERSQSVEPLMKELGAPWLIIKAIMASASPPLTLEVTGVGLSILFSGYFVQKNAYSWDGVNVHKTPDGGAHPAEVAITQDGGGVATTVKFPRGTLVSKHLPQPLEDGRRVQMLNLVMTRKDKKTGKEIKLLDINRIYKEKV